MSADARPAGGPPAPVRVAQLVLRLDVGGLERMVLGMLSRLDRRRFTPLVCVLEEAGALAHELAALDVPLTVLRRRPGAFDPRLVLSLASWLRREQVALVHSHNPAPHLYGSLAAALARAGARSGPRLIHTKHGRNVPHTRRSVALSRLASSLSDRIVAVSDDARAVALEVERVSPRKVVTVVNGVDLTRFRPADDPGGARARLGVPAGGFHVGCVARLSAEKDHASLLEAFAILRRDVPDAHLTLVGDGPLRTELESRARGLGLSAEALTFAGMRSDVAASMTAFDVFALASLTEGISLTLLEAAAAGLPIVATRVGGNPEVVIDEETGLLVPPAQPTQLAAALRDLAGRADRRAMGLRGRARVEARFSEDGMVRHYQALYADVLGLVSATPGRRGSDSATTCPAVQGPPDRPSGSAGEL